MAEDRRTPVLAVRGLSFSITSNGSARRLLNEAGLELYPGDTACISGPSGAGKTSLLWALARMLPAESGDLFLNGKPAAILAPHIWRTRVALVMQNPALSHGSVFNNLNLPWTLKARTGAPPDKRTLHLEMHSVGLGDVDMDRDASSLSGGQVARVALLRSLITQPDVLLLDEPTAALDDESAAMVFTRLRQFTQTGGVVLAVLHQRTPPFAHRAFHLENGWLKEVAP